MAVPKRFADFNPVSVSYSPLVPIISEASAIPIPITEKAANEIQNSGFPPLGKIFSFIGDSAKKASSNPDFNALMGVLAQYLIANNQGVEMEPTQPIEPPKKSWFRRLNDFWNLSPAQKREQELQEQQQIQQQNAAVQRRQFLSSAAPFVGRIANAYVPGSGDLVTSGLLALGKKLGFGRRKRRCGGAAGEKATKAKKKKKYIYIKDEATGETLKLGLKGNFENDVKEVARDAFTTTLSTKMEKGKAKKFVNEIFEGERLTWIANLADLFALVIGLIKPEWRLPASSVSNLVKFGDQVARSRRASNEASRKQSLADFKEHINKELKKRKYIIIYISTTPNIITTFNIIGSKRI